MLHCSTAPRKNRDPKQDYIALKTVVVMEIFLYDEQRKGKPSTSNNNDNIKAVNQMIRDYSARIAYTVEVKCRPQLGIWNHP